MTEDKRAATLPDWTQLSAEQRTLLENLAASFGMDPAQSRETTEGGAFLPTKMEAHCIALEMFTVARMILLEGTSARQ